MSNREFHNYCINELCKKNIKTNKDFNKSLLELKNDLRTKYPGQIFDSLPEYMNYAKCRKANEREYPTDADCSNINNETRRKTQEEEMQRKAQEEERIRRRQEEEMRRKTRQEEDRRKWQEEDIRRAQERAPRRAEFEERMRKSEQERETRKNEWERKLREKEEQKNKKAEEDFLRKQHENMVQEEIRRKTLQQEDIIRQKKEKIINCFTSKGIIGIIPGYELERQRFNFMDYLSGVFHHLPISNNTTELRQIYKNLKKKHAELEQLPKKIHEETFKIYDSRQHVNEINKLLNNSIDGIRFPNVGRSPDILGTTEYIKAAFRTSYGDITDYYGYIAKIRDLIECWILLMVTIVPELEYGEEFGGKRKKNNKKSNKKTYKKSNKKTKRNIIRKNKYKITH